MKTQQHKLNMANKRKNHHHEKTIKSATMYDVIIAGGGPVGLTMATVLGSQGLRVAVIEKRTADELSSKSYDGRTTAIAFSSVQILESAGIWHNISDLTAPILDIKVADQHSALTLDFASDRRANTPFGYIIENTILRGALFNRIAELVHVDLFASWQIIDINYKPDHVAVTCNDGTLLKAHLLIAADGKHSFCRHHADIQTKQWSYHETALVTVIGHSNPHHNKALEHFFPGGPFAVLPMTDNRSSIVWTEKPETAQTLAVMDDENFIELLKDRGCKDLGDIQLLSTRQLWPLEFMLCEKLYAPRLAIVGEAAHAMHPIAGQGLNLSLRDVDVLAKKIIHAHHSHEDIGQTHLLKEYADERAMDHFTFMTATDILAKLFSNNRPMMRRLRRLGLALIQHTSPAKRFFTKMAMGLLTR